MRYVVALLMIAALLTSSADAKSRHKRPGYRKPPSKSLLLKKKRRLQNRYPMRGKEPIPEYLRRKMAELGTDAAKPVLIRIFKQEHKLEIWKETADGTYVFLRSYQICTYSGKIGPKFEEGDRQSPEGFYAIAPDSMVKLKDTHIGKWLSMNVQYPNDFDKANERTGSAIAIHGGCNSVGCFAMTNGWIKEIFAFVREAHTGGQASVPVHVFPFRMNTLNMTLHRLSKHYRFWENIKEGYDFFESTHLVPQVGVCEKRYIFNTTCEADQQ